MEKRLVRRKSGAVLGGVCNGLGDYLGVDPVLVRIFFLLLVVLNGAGTLIYLILWVTIPAEDTVGSPELGRRINTVGSEFGNAMRDMGPRRMQWIGAGLLAFGLVALLDNLGVHFFSWLQDGVVWAVVLMVTGAVLVWRALRGGGN